MSARSPRRLPRWSRGECVTESAATSSPNANVAAARSPESGGAADEASPICTATSPGSCAGTSQNANAEDTKRIASRRPRRLAHPACVAAPSAHVRARHLERRPAGRGPLLGHREKRRGGVRISNEGGPSPPNEAMDAGAAPIAATVTVVHRRDARRRRAEHGGVPDAHPLAPHLRRPRGVRRLGAEPRPGDAHVPRVHEHRRRDLEPEAAGVRDVVVVVLARLLVRHLHERAVAGERATPSPPPAPPATRRA